MMKKVYRVPGTRDQRKAIWKAIQTLIELGEKDAAYELRKIYDTKFRQW